MTTTLSLKFGPTVSLVSTDGNVRTSPTRSAHFRAFALVCPQAWGRADWKEEVSAVLHPADLTAAGVTIEQVEKAVEFFTATSASTRKVEIHGEPGVFAFVVKAQGYRRGPAC